MKLPEKGVERLLCILCIVAIVLVVVIAIVLIVIFVIEDEPRPDGQSTCL